MRQKEISDYYETYRRRIEDIIIRNRKVPETLPSYKEVVDPSIEPRETQTVDRFPPLTVEEGKIVEDLLSNERDWYGAMQFALREPCRRNNTLLLETVQEFIAQVGTWMGQAKTEAADSVRLQNVEYL